jgi:hypothetical protein
MKYEFTPAGIAGMSDMDIHMTFIALMGNHSEHDHITEEEYENLRRSITAGLRLAGGPQEEDFDFEKSHEIIDIFIKRFMKIIDKSPEALEAMKELYKGHGDLKEIFQQEFERLLYGNWYNRRLIIEWFHKNSQRINDEAPTILKNTKYGRGVFASRDIKRGDLIAYYPMDWVSDSKLVPKQKDTNTETFSEEQLKWICLQNAGIIGYGNPYDEQGNPERILQELRESEGRMCSRINDYGFSFASDDGSVHIWGDPLVNQPNSWFRGCMINDGAYNPKQTEEGYYKEFMNMARGLRVSKCNTRLATRMTASRDIKKGEEILTVYGKDYWFGGASDQEGENIEKFNWNSRHNALNLKSRGQKKKFKAKKKEMAKTQNEGFEMFRRGLLERLQEGEYYEGFDGNKWRVVILEVKMIQGGRFSLDAVVCKGNDGNEWIDGHPTQFSKYYPKHPNAL